MAQLIIEIPDNKVVEVRDAISKQLGYDTNKLPDETKTDFIKRMTARWLKGLYQTQMASDAQATASATSLATTATVNIT